MIVTHSSYKVLDSLEKYHSVRLESDVVCCFLVSLSVCARQVLQEGAVQLA